MGANDLILDRYKPLGQAGSGGFGTVQVAWDPRIQRKVAIKTIKLTELDAYRAGLPGADAIGGVSDGGEGLPWDEYPESAYDGNIYDDYSAYDAYDEFNGYLEDDFGDSMSDGQNPAMVRALSHLPGLDEARTVAMLSDPRIVTVYDFEIRGRTAYLIMEYVEGITLTRLLHDYDGQLTLDMVASVFDSVSGALIAAHEAGVLHLDIKPDNILLNPQGQVKVTDFGLATLADASGEGKTGGGTIGYMPPEQMRREYLDARSDEWSLASVTYEMLSGTNPFVVASLDEAEAAINDAELVLPSLCWEGLDEEIDDVLFTALDPDRDERYDSVAEFADELLPYLGDEDEGRLQLSALVHDALGIVDIQDDEEEEDEEEALSNVRRSVRRTSSPLRERISKHLLGLAARAFAAIGCAAVVLEAVINVPALYNLTPNFGGLVLVVTLAAAALGAVFPHVGALVAFIVLAAALIAGGSPIAGVVLIIASGLWWWFVGRGGKAVANSVLSLPLAGAIGGNVFAPLVAGASLAPLRALGTAAFCVVVALVFGAMGTNNLIWWNAYTYWRFSQVEVDPAFIAMLTQPATWCIAASWIAGAGVGGLISQRGTRTSLLIGLALSVVIMIAGDLGAVWLDAGHMALIPIARLVAPLVVSVIVIVATIMWLRPDPEPDDEEDVEMGQ